MTTKLEQAARQIIVDWDSGIHLHEAITAMREALADPQITTPDVCGEVCARAKLCYGCNKDLEEANAKYVEQAEQEPVKLIYEDELPEDYPYDEMFSRSIIIEGVRMFPEVQTEHSVVNESLTAEDSQIPAFLRRAGSFGG